MLKTRKKVSKEICLHSTTSLTRLRIHECTISLRFLGVLRLEVSVWMSKTKGTGVWLGMVFYQVFLLSPLHCTETVRGCVSLQKYKSLGKAVEVNVNRKEENSEDFLSGFRPRIRPMVAFKFFNGRWSLCFLF
jgi:hypothetical protein